MNDSSNMAEYTVTQKAEGKYRTRRLLFILMYIGFALLYFLLFITKIPMLICILPIFIWMLVFFTWRFCSVEHEYSIASASVTFADIYGGRSRKTILEHKIKDMEKIAPLTDDAKADYADADITIDMRGSVHTPDGYFCTFRDESGKKTCVFFEATNKTLKAFKYYNSSTVMSTTLRY